jgi:phage gpG-like protein
MARRDEFEKGEKWERMEKLLADPTPLLARVGALVVAESQFAFQAQEFDGEQWPERGGDDGINLFGLLADMAADRTPPQRRFEPRPALSDTGRLAASINFRVSGKGVDVGTPMLYAQVHQEGGDTESVPLSTAVQSRLRDWLFSRAGAQYRSKLLWLTMPRVTGATLTTTVPQRRFIGLTDEVREEIPQIILSLVDR